MMILFFESVLNGVVLFVVPLMLLAAMGTAVALTQRFQDLFARHSHHGR